MSLPSESQASTHEARSTTVHRSLSESHHDYTHAARRGSSGGEDHTTWTQFLREDQDLLMDSSSPDRDDNSSTSPNRKRRLRSGSSRSGGGSGGGGSSTGIEIPGARATQPVSIRQHSRPGASETGTRPSGSPSFVRPDEETTETQSAASPPSSSMSRQLNSLRHRERSFTDYRLPRWQPDSEVTECPICGITFTFWFRKHHCRKCGRVVCAACSPHRITIPQQFIVRPPEAQTQLTLSSLIQRNTTDREGVDLIDDEEVQPQLSPSQSRSHHRATSIHQIPRNALGGGTEVRLCNPCVPDPNPEPPRRYRASSMLKGPVAIYLLYLLGWREEGNGTRNLNLVFTATGEILKEVFAQIQQTPISPPMEVLVMKSHPVYGGWLPGIYQVERQNLNPRVLRLFIPMMDSQSYNETSIIHHIQGLYSAQQI
ncbi:TPA_exp: Uncharacterized protein A8136_1244 [Trichophyton benhamiae CBS 112371]|nr:TPA_exp: Uncharacterized protein A8136_1244 [Trichophyton benhamiae CBS 112371]